MTSTGSSNETQSPDTPSSTRTPGRGKLLLWVALLTGAVAACWLALPHAMPALKGWLARRHLPEMRAATQQRDWSAAIAAMHAARRWAPDDPDVLHAGIDLVLKATSDPHTIIGFVQRLQASHSATTEDLALMGRMHLRLGESTKARVLFEGLPPAARQQRQALMLLADLLSLDGNQREAHETRRAALQAGDPTSDDLLELALLDLDDSDPARRAAIREQLWELARSPQESALEAIALLADTPDLPTPKVDTLRALVDSHSAPAARKEVFRLRVLSAQLRLTPHLRSEILDQETTRWTGRTPQEITPLANWLAENSEFERVLSMIPAQTAARYTDLLPPYVMALRGRQQWRELDALLKSRTIDPAFSPQKQRLWKAEVEANLDHNVARAQQTLTRVFEEAGRGEQLTDTLEAGYLAEKFHIWDLALRCFQGAAAKHPQTRQVLLPKVFQMAELQHDATAMLRACDDLITFRPGSVAYQLQKLYLQLVIGTELETSQQALKSIEIAGSPARSDQFHLLRALSAYRQNEAQALRAEIPQISQPENLPPGQRAVYAALLKLSGGDIGRAFRLVERVSPHLLLPEERVFLRRAL